MLVLPGLAALPAARVKFTALAERPKVSDSARVAFRAMGCAPELIACAEAIETANVIASTTIAIRMSFVVFKFSPSRFFNPLLTCCCSAKAQSTHRSS